MHTSTRQSFIFRSGQVVRTLAVLATVTAIAAAFSVGTAYAASINVTTTSDKVKDNDGKCSLREAIRAADYDTASGSVVGECIAGQAGSTDTITLKSGNTYKLTDTSAGALDILDDSAAVDVILNTTGSGKATIKQSVDGKRVLHVYSGVSAEVDNIIFSGGEMNDPSNTAGGGDIRNDGTLALTRCMVKKGFASTNGGGIYSSGTLTLDHSTVSSNVAGQGGGIYNDAGTVTLTATKIDANSAGDGGGIYNDSGMFWIYDSTISKGYASQNGGGIYSNWYLNLFNTVVSANESYKSGGGLYALLHVTFTDSVVTGNSTSGSPGLGGGIYTDAVGFFERSVVRENSAAYGGGIYCDGCEFDLDYSLFWKNDAFSGGSLYFLNGNIRIVGSRFSANNAGIDGGAIYRADATITSTASVLMVTTAAFIDNTANGDGDAIYNGLSTGLDPSSIHDSCFVNNGDTAYYSVNSTDKEIGRNNWWGKSNGPSGSGPGGGDSVNNGVDYSDYLGSADGTGCEVLTHGDMEFDINADGLPDYWDIGPNTGPGWGDLLFFDPDASFMFSGNGNAKSISQSVLFGGIAGDSFTLTVDNKSDSIPTTGKYQAVVVLTHKNGSTEKHTLTLSTGTHNWQTKTLAFTANKDYIKIQVQFVFKETSGTAQIDDVTLEFTQ